MWCQQKRRVTNEQMDKVIPMWGFICFASITKMLPINNRLINHKIKRHVAVIANYKMQQKKCQSPCGGTCKFPSILHAPNPLNNVISLKCKWSYHSSFVIVSSQTSDVWHMPELKILHIDGTARIFSGYCKRVYFRRGKISRKCWQDISRGGDFHNTTPISFIKVYEFYIRMGVIFAKKTKEQITRKLPPHKNFHIYSIYIELWTYRHTCAKTDIIYRQMI